MVKNSNGGGNAKKQGRKHQAKEIVERKMDPQEREVEVCEMMGGSICKVKIEGVERRCHIGGKFRGRNKRSNYIEKGIMIIVGIREWNQGGDVDVTYVYGREESAKLKRVMEEEEEEEVGFEFVEERMTEKEKIEMITGTINRVEETTEIRIEEL